MTTARQLDTDLELDLLVGAAAVRAQLPCVADLAVAAGAPVTARCPWIEESVDDSAWALTVRAGGALLAAAVLHDEALDGVTVTTLAGTAEGHRGALLAVDDGAARALGSALASALLAEPRRFVLGPLTSGPALGALLQYLQADVHLQPLDVPLLRPTGEPESELAPAMRRNLRKARNRLASDGVDWRVEVLDQGSAIAAMLPLVLTIARDRDRACGRTSPLDEPLARKRWRTRLLGLAEHGSLRLVTLLLDDEVAAYALAVLDGDVVRVLDGRYVDRFSRYAPGRLLEAHMLEQVRLSDRYTCLDWMTTVGPESLLGSNDVERLVVLRGQTRRA